jgi:hypothetical protein
MLQPESAAHFSARAVISVMHTLFAWAYAFMSGRPGEAGCGTFALKFARESSSSGQGVDLGMGWSSSRGPKNPKRSTTCVAAVGVQSQAAIWVRERRLCVARSSS